MVKKYLIIFILLIFSIPSFAQIEVSSWSIHARHYDKKTKRTKHYQFYTKEKQRQEIRKISKDKCEILLHFDKDAIGKVFYFRFDGWENFDFWYQAPLTRKQKKIISRPDNVEGSYAIYWKNSWKGKFGHLYRPELVDVNGKKSWCKLDYRGNGRFRITCPRIPKKGEVLDPTLGRTSIGAGTLTGMQTQYNSIGGFLCTANAVGIKHSIGIWSTDGTKKLKFALYTDNGLGATVIKNGYPSTLVTNSSGMVTATRTSAPTQASECEFVTINCNLIAGTTYHFAESHEAGISRAGDATGTELYSYKTGSYTTFPPITYPSPRTDTDTQIWTEWIDYTIPPPSTILNLTAIIRNSSNVNLSWTAPGTASFTGRYDIQYSTWLTDTGGDVEWSTGTAQLFISTTAVGGALQYYPITGLDQNTTYYVRMWTEDNAVSDTSLESNIATSYALDVLPPSAVNDGTGTDISSTYSNVQLKANWTLAPSATGYLYAIGTTAGGTEASGWQNNSIATTTVTVDLIIGVTYYFSVKSVAGGVESVARNSNGQFVNSVPHYTAGYMGIGDKDSTIGADVCYNFGGYFIVDTTPTIAIKMALWDANAPMKVKVCIKSHGEESNMPAGAISNSFVEQIVTRTIKPTDLSQYTTFYFFCTSLGIGATIWLAMDANSATMSLPYDTAITSWSVGAGELYADFPATNNYARQARRIYSAYALAIDVNDITNPVAVPYVYDGEYCYDLPSSTKQYSVKANWGRAEDDQSGIQYYKYAIGTTVGGSDTYGWTSTANYYSTSAVVTGSIFSLNSTTYYFTVKAVNGVGLESDAVNSNGQWIDTKNSFKQTAGKFGNATAEASEESAFEDAVVFEWFCAEEDIIAKHLYVGMWQPDSEDVACGAYEAYPKFALYASSDGVGVSADPANGGLPGDMVADFSGVWITSTSAFGGNWVHQAVNYTLTQGTTYWYGFSNCNQSLKWLYKNYDDGAIHSMRVATDGAHAYPSWNSFPYNPAEMAWNDPTGGLNHGTTPATRTYRSYIHSIYLMGDLPKKKGSNKIIIIGQ